MHLGKGENTLNGQQALAYSRIREPSECPGKGKSAFTFGYYDLDRENAQQAVINGIKDRLDQHHPHPLQLHQGPDHRLGRADSVRLDMGFFTMPQLVVRRRSGTGGTNVLCGTSVKEARSAATGRKARSKSPSRSAAPRSTA